MAGLFSGSRNNRFIDSTTRGGDSSVKGIKSHLFLLLLVILIPMILIQGVVYYQWVKDRWREETETNLEVARAVGRGLQEHIKAILDHERLLGAVIVSHPNPSGEHIGPFMSEGSGKQDSIRYYGWIDSRGRVLSPEATASKAVANHRSLFAPIYSGKEWVVSDLLPDSLYHKPGFFIARGIHDSRGTLKGIVFGAADPDRFAVVTANIKRMHKGAILIFDRMGTLVYRYPPLSVSWEDRHKWLDSHPSIRKALGGTEAMGVYVSPGDDVRRVGVTHPVEGIGWVVGASYPEKMILSSLARMQEPLMAFMVGVTLLCVVAAILISNRLIRRIRRLGEHARALGEGRADEMPSTAGVRELDDLHLVIDRMARQLADQTEAANRRAREAEEGRRALQESEARLDAVIESVPFDFWFIDQEGRCVIQNKASIRHWGNQLGKRTEELGVDPSVREQWEENNRRALAGEVVTGESSYRHDGEDHVYFIMIVPVQSGDSISGAVGVNIDITERVRAEAALRESESRFRTLTEALPQMVWSARADGNLDFVNSRWREVTGTQPERSFREGWQEILHPDCLEPTKQLWAEALQTGKLYQVEHRIRTADGSYRWYLTRALPLRDSDGRIVRWIGTATDIHDKRTAEEAIRESEEKFRKLAENANAVIGIVQGRKFVYANPYLLQLTVYTQDELTSMDISDLVHPDDQAMVVDRARRRQLGEPMPSRYEFRIVTKDGRTRWLEFAPARIEYKGAPAVIGIATDVTDRKLAEAELRNAKDELETRVAERTVELTRSNEELEQFAYVSSHDLQEPLRMVASYVGLLEYKYADQLDDEAREYIGYAVEGSRRMQRLIKDLLEFSRVSRKGKPLTLTDSELALTRATENLRVMIEEADAEVTHDPLPSVVADDVQLMQVFQNLIENGIKFHREGVRPRVHVSAAQTGAEWLFCVRDNGIGIEPQYYDKIFVIFQRLHTRRHYPGTGIGLAIFKRIVERHGGQVCVESKVGEGTVFYFTIPAREIAATPIPSDTCELVESK